MGIRDFDLDGGGFVRTGGGEGDGAGLFCGLFLEEPAQIDPPGDGNDVDDIFAEKQEIVGDGDQREQIIRHKTDDRIDDHIVQRQGQIHHGEDPCFHGDEEEQQEMGVGIEGRITQKQAQVQIVNIGITAEEHAEHVHQHHTGEVKQIEPEGSPCVFHGAAQGVITQQTDSSQDDVTGIIGKDKTEKPPDLSLQNSTTVKAQKGIENTALVEHAHSIHDSAADGNVQHQVGDAFIAILIAKPFETAAKVFQSTQLLVISICIITAFSGNVHKRIMNNRKKSKRRY